MVIFLYKCEICGAALFSEVDHDNTWYWDCNGRCKMGTYHNKVMLKATQGPFGDIYADFVGHMGEKNDSQRKASADDDRSIDQ